MAKVKSRRNKAEQVETGQVNIENMSIEELAELQAIQYERIINAQTTNIQARDNLRVIKAILDKRKNPCQPKKETTG